MTTTKNYIRVQADPENLAVIRGFVRLNAVTLGAGRDQIGDIVVAVDEAVTNVILHGYQNRGGIIEVELQREGHYVAVYVRDQAPSFNPLKVPEPDLDIPLEQRPLGGLGIHLMRQAMDSLEYRPLPGGGNELVMRKHV